MRHESAPHTSSGKFAPCFDGERDMFEIQYPGLVAGEVVPRDWDTLVAMHAETVRAQFGDLRIALLGHSIGGCTAQAVAAKSIELGSPPAGLVLGDTYPVTEANSSQDWLLDLPASRVTRAGVQFGELTGDFIRRSTVDEPDDRHRPGRKGEPRP
ncbi:thioesterase domain-containing protein [Streptomyces violaceusniger]|uniref:thioesterase domain-containing protein n=1 Tax=Streptomyces violaceusniger TaxID=68280 RepID=UPI0036AB3228